MDTTSRLTIGDLAGYRLYDTEAVARLETAVALRELGFDLDTVRRLLDRQVGLDEVHGNRPLRMWSS